MIITNDLGTYYAWSNRSNDPSSSLMIASSDPEALERMFISLELAGVSEDHGRPKELFAEMRNTLAHCILPNGETGVVARVDRASFCLWMNFEALNYMLYDYTELQKMVATQ